MSDKRFTYTQTVQKPLPYPLADMVWFVDYLEKAGKLTRTAGFTDEELVNAVFSFWDRQHGED